MPERATNPTQQSSAKTGEHEVQRIDDLVYDVGMHLGEDCDFYLRKGFRVVGFEANPSLVQHNKRRFSSEIADGRVVIVEGAIVPPGAPTIYFYRHPTKSAWGTTAPDWVDRNAHRGGSSRAEVQVVDFDACLRKYGVPWFLKVDIEGADLHCLEVLQAFSVGPMFLSIESEKNDWTRLEREFDVIESLGFDRFAAVQQEGLHRKRQAFTTCTLDGRVFDHRFEEHASGPFGADVRSWGSRKSTMRRYRRIFRLYKAFGDGSPIQRHRVGFVALKVFSRLARRPLPGWYDTHAARSTNADDR